MRAFSSSWSFAARRASSSTFDEEVPGLLCEYGLLDPRPLFSGPLTPLPAYPGGAPPGGASELG